MIEEAAGAVKWRLPDPDAREDDEEEGPLRVGVTGCGLPF